MSKELPPWYEPGIELPQTDEAKVKKNERSIEYRRKVRIATPLWLTDKQRQQIREIYRECKRQRKQGRKVAVDHIVPVQSKFVSGLQVPWNLQIITEAENAAKSNIWWPDHPFENLDMFEKYEPHQLSLKI